MVKRVMIALCLSIITVGIMSCGNDESDDSLQKCLMGKMANGKCF